MDLHKPKTQTSREFIIYVFSYIRLSLNLGLWKNNIVFRMFLSEHRIWMSYKNELLLNLSNYHLKLKLSPKRVRGSSPQRDNLPVEPDTWCLRCRLPFLSAAFEQALPTFVFQNLCASVDNDPLPQPQILSCDKWIPKGKFQLSASLL